MALTGDVNGDGRDDIVWRGKDGAVFSWLGQSDGSFAASGISPIAIDDTWHIVPHDLWVS
jgi:hypothetical protein